MTREKIIKEYEGAVVASGLAAAVGNEEAAKSYELFKAGLNALRPVSREQVEKVWRGEWEHTHSIDNLWTEVWVCSHCGFEDDNGDCFDFCPACGKAMTDEAVDIRLEELEALKDDLV